MKSILKLTALVCLAGILAACSLAEDITPPPDLWMTQTAIAPLPAIPAQAPNPQAGAVVYNAHCIRCHGPAGQGDGDLAAELAAQRPAPLPDFSQPATFNELTPQKMYNIVTRGRLEQFMPPFGEKLTDQQRWDVIAYLFSFAAPDTTLAAGETVFAAQCATCHSAGPLTSLPYFAEHATADMQAALATADHSALTLSDTERAAALAYLRALAFDTAPVIAEVTATPEVISGHPPLTPTTDLTRTLVISGLITNGSVNAGVPDGTEVVVYVFNEFQIAGAYTVTTSGGRYELPGLALEPNQVIIASVEYGGLFFSSDIAHYTEGAPGLDASLTVYDSTSDTAQITVDSWHIVFEPAPEAALMRVAEWVVISNVGDKVFVAAHTGEPVLVIPLPPTATNLQFQDSTLTDQVVTTAAGFGYLGAVSPGAQTLSLLFSYELPFAQALDLVRALPYRVDAVNVLAPQTGLNLSATGLTGPTPRDMQGTVYQLYSGAALVAGQPLTLQIAPMGGAATTTTSIWVWGAGVASVVALVVVGAWLWQRRRMTEEADEDEEAVVVEAVVAALPTDRRAKLIQALAQLDDDFAEGVYDDGEYQRRRQQLKAEVLGLNPKGL